MVIEMVNHTRGITGKHLVASLVTIWFGYLAWVYPGDLIEPYMPWAWPAVVVMIALVSYTVIDIIHRSIQPARYRDTETAGGEPNDE